MRRLPQHPGRKVHRMSMEDLSSILWHERDLLDLLLFKLEVQQLVLSNDRSHWLARAGREIEAVLEKIREVELLRAVTTDTLASELGLEPDASLRTISQTSAEPWRGIWLDHREALIDASTRIS